ncbi:hypothetical protein K501DRAFT_192293 [Backusella circina FSU 941]|nr:hypothetical protein K501DRAFT_192293 [Backusella circina FSU 941]
MTTLVCAAPVLEKRSSMSGSATFYNVGLGFCGQTNDSSEMVAALSSEFMSHDYCGKFVTIQGEKGSVTVKVVDSCPGCAKGDIDLSEAAFKKLAALNDGRIPVTWSI